MIEPSVDGRTARRDRNSDAVLDAVHELYVEGQLLPTFEDVAARSGVSLRSVYRYFPDRHEALQAALRRRIQVAEPHFELAGLGEGALDERISRFVDHRLGLYEMIAPTARVALSRSHGVPAIAKVVELRRQQLTDQARAHFATELGTLPNAQAQALLACVDILSQFEAIEQLRVQRGLSVTRSRRTLVTGLSRLLAPRETS